MDKINEIIKQTALDANRFFEVSGYPSTNDENWRYNNLSNIIATNFITAKREKIPKNYVSKFFIKDCYHIVSINGYYDSSISDKLPGGIEISNIINSNINIKNIFSKISSYKLNPFNAINTSKFQEGILLSISHKEIDKPIQLINFFLSEKTDRAHYPRLLVKTENESSFSLINHFISRDSKQHLINSVVEMDISQNSKINYNVIQQGNIYSNSINSTGINQSSNSKLNYNSFTLDGKFTRNDIEINLKNSSSEINLQGLFLGNQNNTVDYHTIINHKSGNCVSKEKFQGILKDKSKGVFNGLINVFPKAINTNSNQENRNLLLSDFATMNSNPQLEIFCDDVSCTHGSTTGYLDEEMIFYLRSRGIGEIEAKHMLISGFAREIINNVSDDCVKNFLYDKIDSWIN